MPGQEKILCVDWGTSAFRLMLADRASAEVLAADQTERGIARMFELAGRYAANERHIFYRRYIEERVTVLEERTGISLKGVPLFLSGMASSSIGMEELPYKTLPFSADGSDLLVKIYGAFPAPAREIFLVSGVKSGDHDVMRGEETLLVGSAAHVPGEKEDWFIFPGTHSKHILVSHGQAIALRTFMTGEFFELLSRHSILAHAILKGERFGGGNTKEQFRQGVLRGLGTNLLQRCFQVRTNRLFDVCTEGENYYFLSGLLIGNELSALPEKDTHVVLVCGDVLRPLYEAAFEVLKMNGYTLSYRCLPAEEALVRGQLQLYSLLKK